MRKGFGVIDILMGILITAALFILLMPELTGSSGKKGPVKTPDAKQQADEMINEIEQMRQKAVSVPADED
ncbi:MAG: hypothetical protein LBK53_01090 [Heliobacteriaceae bacterium]|jgi:predicted small lipoprotein YifL|nr:hypothetical protein [Heliobacteriaceae bacterium]